MIQSRCCLKDAQRRRRWQGIIHWQRIRETMPDVLKVTAVTDDGEIMAVQHVEYPIYGVQFHPDPL